MGFCMVLTGRANAASWNGPTILPRDIQPRSPWTKHSQAHYVNTQNVMVSISMEINTDENLCFIP